MASHLSSIGFTVESEDDFAVLAERVAATAEPVDLDEGGYLQWRDTSGAELWLQTDRHGELIGMNPHFHGESRIRVSLTEKVTRSEDTELDGGFYGWADPSGAHADNGTYPFVFDVPDFLCYSDVRIPGIAEVQIAAFAHELDLYDTPETFAASQTESIKFASQSFIPSGLFSPEGDPITPPSAYAIFTGHIVATEGRVNNLTDRAFQWILVDTLGGVFDVLCDPALLRQSPLVGGVASGSFWLSGRLVEYPHRDQGFFRRILGW